MPTLDGIVPDTEYYALTPAGLEFPDAWLGPSHLVSSPRKNERQRRASVVHVVPKWSNTNPSKITEERRSSIEFSARPGL
jgi:hypothetical protein